MPKGSFSDFSFPSLGIIFWNYNILHRWVFKHEFYLVLLEVTPFVSVLFSNHFASVLFSNHFSNKFNISLSISLSLFLSLSLFPLFLYLFYLLSLVLLITLSLSPFRKFWNWINITPYNSCLFGMKFISCLFEMK